MSKYRRRLPEHLRSTRSRKKKDRLFKDGEAEKLRQDSFADLEKTVQDLINANPFPFCNGVVYYSEILDAGVEPACDEL